jgi:hypothetical protein
MDETHVSEDLRGIGNSLNKYQHKNADIGEGDDAHAEQLETLFKSFFIVRLECCSPGFKFGLMG